jgi:transposase
MAMGKRTSEQAPLWVPTTDLPVSPGHPFYTRLNRILDDAGFERFAEEQCQRFYAPVMGRPSQPPGRYFRLLLDGYFEGLDSERGIAWHAADSLAVRSFVGLGLDAAAPDHSTSSRTRRLIDVEPHRRLHVGAGAPRGRRAAQGPDRRDRCDDARGERRDAQYHSARHRPSSPAPGEQEAWPWPGSESYQEFLMRLALASEIRTPTREALARLDRRRKVAGHTPR